MNKREKADKIVHDHIMWSMGAGLVPVPLLDVAAVTVIQIDMIKQLCRAYKIKYSETQGKAWVAALTGSTSARVGASVVLKLIPGYGTIVGGVSMSVLSGASTYAVGQIAISHFESGGDFLNIDLEGMKKAYKDKFEEGKKVASDMKGEKETPVDEADVYEKLEKLGNLKEKGIITEEEFEAKKKELLAKI